jgi:hypothetical protein
MGYRFRFVIPRERTDRLSEIAWSPFGKTPPGSCRVQAICDYVHRHTAFGYEQQDGSGSLLRSRPRSDAADVAISTTFGPSTLSSFTVVTEEVASGE